MDIFPWNENFEIGIQAIDDQHRGLVALLNRLADGVAASSSPEHLARIIDELAAYADDHFATEEAIWHKHLANDPAALAHNDIHQSFRDEVVRLRGALMDCTAQDVAERTLEFLARWLASHILESDRYMACALQARREGLAGEAAYARAREMLGGATRILTGIILEMYAKHTRNTLRLVRELSAQHRTEQALARQHTYRALILELAMSFINLPLARLDSVIEDALERIATFFAADRAYVFRYDFTAQTTSNSHEWCAPGVTPMIDTLQDLPLSNYPDWWATHCRGQSYVVPDVSEMPPGPERDILESQHIRSLLTAPLMDGANCLGFVGFDSVRGWRDFGRDEGEILELFANLLTSISQRKAVAESLREKTEELAIAHDRMLSILDGTNASVYVADMQTDEVLFVNAVGRRLLGDVVGKTWWAAIQGQTRGPCDVYTNPLLLDADGRPTPPVVWEHYNPRLQRWFQLHDQAIPWGNGRYARLEIALDITEQKAQQRQLERIAHYDPLTGLPNRVLLADRLQQAMALARRQDTMLAIVYLDLDGFKLINDRYGHDAGDRLLVAIAKHMRQTLRTTDTLARLGGDEFVAVLTDLPNPNACVPLLIRLLDAVSEESMDTDCAPAVSASLGVTVYPQNEPIDADQLLRQADQAMYQAKLSGKNRYHLFDVDHDQALRGHHEHLARLTQALAAREFVLHYQPKVNMRSGEVVGVEALIRWQHPERALLSPAEFLPSIEGQPFEIALGNWVIETALAQTLRWREAGMHLTLSVNVAPHQLQHPGFVRNLAKILHRYPAVPPRELELEILESSALQDLEWVTQVLADCRSLGVGFALDDFGTGYSSLTYLKRLPARTLKIDHSFVRNMLNDPEDRAILEGVLGLAHAFQRVPVAEGVESVAHGVALLDLDCELAQGYVIAAPMPADKIPSWLADWQPPAAWVGRL